MFYSLIPAGRVASLAVVPMSFVAATDILTGRHTLGVGVEIMGRCRVPMLVMYLSVKFVGIPVISVISTSKYSTGNSVWEYALTSRDLELYVTLGTLGGPVQNKGQQKKTAYLPAKITLWDSNKLRMKQSLLSHGSMGAHSKWTTVSF